MANTFKYIGFALVLLLTAGTGTHSVFADTPAYKTYNPLKEMERTGTEYIHGRGYTSNNYGRLPDDAQGKVRADVWNLSRNSAGLYLLFTTDAPKITVRYNVSGSHSLPHMPATGVSGIDLYNDWGERYWGGYQFGKEEITYTFDGWDHDGKPVGYQLFLPLYTSVEQFEIAIEDPYRFSWIPAPYPDKPESRPIVVYGTSIAQGACASRPGMAWTNILQRKLPGYPVVNLGFSGNGRLESEVLDYIAAIPASVYILDCMPNMYVEPDSVYTLVINAVRQIRRQWPETPIILTDHPGDGNQYTKPAARQNVAAINGAQTKAYEQLISEGYPNLYHLTTDTINMPYDGMVDQIHPTDYGMMSYAEAYYALLSRILNLP